MASLWASAPSMRDTAQRVRDGVDQLTKDVRDPQYPLLVGGEGLVTDFFQPHRSCAEGVMAVFGRFGRYGSAGGYGT
jgi:hypothetical protein